MQKLHIESWVGEHYEFSGYEIVVLATQEIVAFSATGKRAQIVISRGLLDGLPADEIGAVVAHEAAHVRNRHRRFLMPVAALEPVAAVAVPLRLSLDAMRFAVERWADEQSIELGCSRSSLIRALDHVSTSQRAAPVTFLTSEDVRSRVRALESRPQIRRGHTACVIAGLVVGSAVPIVALAAWLW
jgi:beta-lactamase regulating signal transducer with metallopeptidase domain